MKVTIVCESMFGNTAHLAEQVRDGLETAGADVRLVDVADAVPADLADLDLLVLCAPTHALTLSRPESRAEAVARGASPLRAAAGLREWINDIDLHFPPGASRPPVVVFDTRVLKARHWPGSAAVRAARGLRKAGFTVRERASFFVEGVTGPLVDGEALRANEWASRLSDVGGADDRNHGAA